MSARWIRLHRTHVVFVTLLSVLVASAAAAQPPRAAIRGEVVDPALAPLPNVEIVVTQEATNEARRTRTDGKGRFSVPGLAPGAYRIDIKQPNYGPFVARAELTINQEFFLTVPLQLGTVIQAVDVKAPIAPIGRDPALATFIDARQISSLPLDGRNFYELALLAPATAPGPQGSASSVRGDFAFTVNGGREDFNGLLLDGVYNVDPKLNTPGVRPPVDAIREFEVLTSSYDATFGRNGGGQINVVTRSGSNHVEGTAYEFFRNGALDGRNYFAPTNEPAPDYDRHQFGGSLGGPILKNRSFFFADYERTRLREGITRVTSVPTLAERRGDFSQSLWRPLNPLTGQPFPNGQIPSFFMSPIGLAIAALYPAPNRGTAIANFVGSPISRDDIHQFDTRIDQSLGVGSTFTARYSFSDRNLLEPFAGAGFAAVPGFGTEVLRRAQNLAAIWTWTPTPFLVSDLRFGYNRAAIGVFGENTDVNNGAVGLRAFSSNPRDIGLSVISVSGFSPLGHEYTTPQESTTDAFQIADTLTWVHGVHLAKFGAEWHGIRQTAYRDVQSRGFLNFIDQGFTGNALADLLLGLPVLTGGATLDNPQNLRARSWGLFAQDAWRIRPALTLSAGLRYDYAAPPVDAQDRANLYDPMTSQLVKVGSSGLPRGGYDPDRNNVSPRLGFAWTTGGAGHSVIRGGYGIYYNQGALATAEGLYFNAPYFNLGVFFPAPGLPQPTLSDPFPSLFPALPQSATAYQPDLQTPWMEHWSLAVERQIGNNRSLELAVVGSRGHDLISARDMNQATRGVRPNPRFADITVIESRASSRYNALTARFQQRSAFGLSWLASYTYGKSTDDASGFFTSAGDPNFPQNSFDPGAERGRSAFDVRHRFSLSESWDLPFGSGRTWLAHRGWLSKFLAEWEMTGIVTIQTGRPFTVALSPEIDNSLSGRSNLGFGYNDRPNLSGNPSLSNPSADGWFDTAAFSMPAPGTFGSAGRNILDGPGYKNVNAALVKHLRFGTDRDVQIRIEAFNLLGTLNLNLPDAFFGSPTFGRILSAQSPRRVQFGVKAVF
jgi:hypothetical protein